ncbi:MAG: SLC13 family permease [Oscillospiraceae bacterium]
MKIDMEDSAFKRDLKYGLISIAIAIVISLIPPMGMMTSYGMKVMGLFIAFIFAWAVNVRTWFVVASLLALTLISGQSFTSSILPTFIGNSTLLTILFGYTFMAGIRKTGLTEYITIKIMGSRLSQKGPYALMIMLCVAGTVASAITQGFVAVPMLILEMLRQIKKETGIETKNKWFLATAISALLCSYAGLMCAPYSTMYLAVFQVMESYGVTTPSLVTCALVFIVVSIVLIAVFALFTKFILRPKLDADAFKRVSFKRELKFTRPMLWAVTAIVILALTLMLPSLLPSNWALTAKLKTIGSAGVFLFPCLIFVFTKDQDGKRSFDFTSTMNQNVSWGNIWLMGMAFYYSTLLVSDDVGFSATLEKLLAPLSGSNPYIMAIIVLIVVVILTNVLNNFVSVMIMMPVGVQLCASSPAILSMLCPAFVCMMVLAIAFPSSSLLGILIHEDKEMYEGKDIMIWGYVYSIVGAIFAALVFMASVGVGAFG